jgi:nucleoside-diphosphate-sugar epimerase
MMTPPPNPSDLRVLVTGSTGFIGSAITTELLRLGITPITLRRPAADLFNPASVDALLRETRPTHLLHAAWITTPGVYWTSPENLRWYDASCRLFDRFIDLGGRRIVSLGTCAEYDWSAATSADAGVCHESATPLAPPSIYAQSKLRLWQYLESCAAAASISAAWARVFFLHGPGEHPARLVPSIITKLLRNQPADCSAGQHRRDYLHVADVGAACARLLLSEVTDPVNIGSGSAVAIRDLATTIADLLGRRDLLRIGATPTRADEAPLVEADVTRLRDEVGFTPRFDLSAGLAHTIDWWRTRLEASHV